ncbi:MAG: PDZ domain-containing protein, partial [Gammaproteobacteria bacterium]|nr:PDZ domain-containing protein [Gammaproteobacteria bacterium]
IEYVRDGSQRAVTAVLGQQIAEQINGASIHSGLQGAIFATASANTAGGIEVESVEPGSAAAQRGLRAGDIITAVNRRPVQNIAQLREVAAANRILFLLVRRGDRQLMLQVR